MDPTEGDGMKRYLSVSEGHLTEGYEICSICLEEIPLEEMSLIKGCEHAYCVTCILTWAYTKHPFSCPKCKHTIEVLLHRALDGSIHDYMFEESVYLLLRAYWFVPPIVEAEEREDSDASEYDCDGGDDYDNHHHFGNGRWSDYDSVESERKTARVHYKQQWRR